MKDTKENTTPLNVELPTRLRKAIDRNAKHSNRTVKGEVIEIIERAYGMKKPMRDPQPEPELTEAR